MTGDEAKAIFDKFAAADPSMAPLAAVAKQLIDQVAADAQALSVADRCELDARREKDRVDRDNENAYRRKKRREKPASIGRPSDAQTSDGRPADAVSSRARSSSSYLEENKINGGGGDTRARADDENVSAEQIASTVEQIVKETNHWPADGWLHSATVEQIERRLKVGQRPSLIVEAVILACKRDTSGQRFRCFGYFDAPIARAHGEANKAPMLPLDGTGANHGHDVQRKAQQFGSDIIEQLRRADISGGS